MGKAKLTMTLLFVLAMGSGVLAGILVTRLPSATPVQAQSRSPLAEDLRLTSDQTDRMRQIWETVRGKVDECFLRAQEVQKRRDHALMALLTDEQKGRFAKFQQDYDRSLASLKSERDAAFQAAVKSTEQILSPAQKQRYREILKSRLGREPNFDAPDWMSPATFDVPSSSH